MAWGKVPGWSRRFEEDVPDQFLGSKLEFKQSCGWFQVSAQVPLAAIPGAFAAILESIEDLKTRPISETELSQAQSALLSKHRASLEAETGLADQITAIELFDLARDFLSGFPLRVEQISSERVQEAAKNYLSSTQISGVIVGESQSVKAGLAEFRSFEIWTGGSLPRNRLAGTDRILLQIANVPIRVSSLHFNFQHLARLLIAT